MRLFPEPRFKSEYEIATTLLKVAEEETKKRIVRETGGESALAPAERGNYCFVVGGHSDPHHLASVLKLDIRSMRWSACAKMKYKRYKPAAVFSPDGRYLYVFGGHNETDKLDSVEALDTETNEWIELEPMPSKRSHIAGDRQPNSPCAPAPALTPVSFLSPPACPGRRYAVCALSARRGSCTAAAATPRR